MNAKFFTLVGLLSCATAMSAQENKSGYQFKEIAKINVTPVKNQASTGTCWCFATTSFIEAELL
ncbi:MAG: aminopeptidase, partial [Bacteroides sp.]|nr:aminopeptidase [Bacteroides sp.]